MLFYKAYELDPALDWVVFVHGAGGSSTIWYKQVRDFRKRCNVLLIDLRGHGQSASIRDVVRRGKYSFEDIGKEIIDVLDYLDIQSAHFVGISLGSVLIRILAEEYPSRVKTLILGGAILRLNFRSRLLVTLGNLTKYVVPYMILYKFFAWIIMPRSNHRESRRLFAREAQKLCQKEFLRWFKLTHEINPVLRFMREKEIATPSLYLMGEQDHLFLPAVQRQVARHRNSELFVIAGAGHVCNVETPDLFNSSALAFLSRHGSIAA
ncbi:MAG: alpha/beta hydrolase [Rhodothermales bacterium]|nr:alpha/beta hydrolase [Rhodothermales bacterium]